jgi:hypothetical protein
MKWLFLLCSIDNTFSRSYLHDDRLGYMRFAVLLPVCKEEPCTLYYRPCSGLTLFFVSLRLFEESCQWCSLPLNSSILYFSVAG